jgi:hypothetical protein
LPSGIGTSSRWLSRRARADSGKAASRRFCSGLNGGGELDMLDMSNLRDGRLLCVL